MDADTLSFEEAFSRLEDAVKKLEQGNTTLDEAVAYFEEGMKMANLCQASLDAAQLRISQLLQPSDDEPKVVSLDLEDPE
ncbi:MAG: exodeoxyribonuclease VII small subunit [Chloroflexi bacterium]|nr:exodeoxyribonuclease VII small subunit [Chloroflexota bacterium]